MAIINPYLNFNGTTEEAFNFYKSVFGGEFATFQRMKDMPADVPGCDQLTEGDGEKVMHVALPIGPGNVLMGTDVLDSQGHSLTVGNNFSITVSTENKEEADNL